jgi:two-component system phosphate regulon sensor histidine kinase PhoR
LFSSIRWRTAAVFAILILVCIGGLSSYLSHFFRESYLDDLETQLADQAWLVADSSASYFSDGQKEYIDSLAKKLGEGIEGRVTIIGKDGTVLGDSIEDPKTMENHANRPEVIQALAGKTGSSIRYSETLGYDMMYVALPIVVDSELVGVARVSLPLTDINVHLNHINVTIIWVSLLAAAIAILLSLQLSKLTIGPVKKLTSMSRRIAEGEFDQEIDTASRGEVGELATAFNLMAAKIKYMVYMIAAERDLMGVVLSNMGDGTLVIDGEGKVTTINKSACNILQLKKEEVIGQTLIEVARDYELNEIWQRCVQSNQRQTGSVEIRQTKQFLLVIASPLEDEGGCLLLLQNLTELRRLEQVRQDLMSNISHELRTPLASIKALAESLQDGAVEDPELSRDFLSKMNAEIDKLTQMVQELGELSRIESGEAPLRRESMELAEIIKQAVERLRAQSDRAGLSIVLDIPDKLPNPSIDRERIEQVLINLIHNAIKFTPPGGSVTVSARKENSHVLVSVSDTGVGIPADDLPRIFERFYKADKSRSGGGTGLGLAIAKHIIEAHGGRIWAESVEGKGSTFHFTLPLEPQV